MRIFYDPTGISNFHNVEGVSLNVKDEEGDCYYISPGQAKKIAKHFCGVTDCRCPAGGAEEYTEEGDARIQKKYCS